MISGWKSWPSPWRTALAAVAFAAAVSVLSYRASHFLVRDGAPSASEWVMQDFRDIVYYAARAFQERYNPYDAEGFLKHYPVWHPLALYSPLTLILHAPFGALPFDLAWRAYFAFTLLAFVALCLLAFRVNDLRMDAADTLLIATAVILSRPGYMNLLLGQVACTTALAVSVAVYFSRTHPWLAALAVAVSTFKPSFGAPLMFLMFCRGDVGVVLRGAVIAVLATLPPLWRLAEIEGGLFPFLASVQSSLAGFGEETFNDARLGPFRVDFPALIARLGDWPMTRGEEVLLGGSLLLIGGACLFAWRAADGSDQRRRLTGTLISLLILSVTYHQTYDLLLLLVPVVGLCSDRWLPRRWQSRWSWWLLVAGLAMVSINYFATATAIDAFGLSGGARLLVTSINPGAVAMSLFFYLRLAWQRNRLITARG